MRGGSREREDPALPRDLRDLAIRAAVAAGDRDRSARRPRPFTGEDLDHAADGFRAVESPAPAPYHLDAIDVLRRQRGEVEGSERRAVDPDAVDQHQRLVGVGAADEDVRHRAAGPALDDLHARHLA